MARAVGKKRIKEILRLLFDFDNEDGGINDVFEAVIKRGYCPCQIEELGASGECPSPEYDDEEKGFRAKYGLNTSFSMERICLMCWTKALHIPELDD